MAITVLIAMGPGAAVSRQVPPGWGVNSATNALTLAGGEESQTTTTFVFKNSSTKPISAFSVAFEADTTHTIDYFETNNALRPGASYPLTVGNAGPWATDRVVRILAVVFTDGSAEGAEPAIGCIRSKRLGRILETERVRNLLELPKMGVDDASITTLLRKIGSLPTSAEQAFYSVENIHLPGADLGAVRTADKSMIDAFFHGVHRAREDALSRVERLKQLPEPAGAGTRAERARFFAELRQWYENLSAKHRAMLDAWRGGAPK